VVVATYRPKLQLNRKTVSQISTIFVLSENNYGKRNIKLLSDTDVRYFFATLQSLTQFDLLLNQAGDEKKKRNRDQRSSSQSKSFQQSYDFESQYQVSDFELALIVRFDTLQSSEYLDRIQEKRCQNEQ
jgi:hypothetical protein